MSRVLRTFVMAAAVVSPLAAQGIDAPFQQGRQGQQPTTAPAQTAPPGRPGMTPPAQPTAAPSPSSSESTHAARWPNPMVNVRLELSITDTYAGSPSKKIVTMLVANGGSGQVRTSNRLSDGSPVNLNVDARLDVGQAGLVLASMTFQYTPAQSASSEGRPAPRPADLFESVNVLLQDAKTAVVSQSADPATDRKVTVEVTATIVR